MVKVVIIALQQLRNTLPSEPLPNTDENDIKWRN
jgi:hypothetical protein